jgi:hypothetical protein
VTGDCRCPRPEAQEDHCGGNSSHYRKPDHSVDKFRLDIEATAIITISSVAVDVSGALNAGGMAANV